MEWVPKTNLGKMVAAGAITLDDIFKTGKKIKEYQIVDRLIPGIQSEVILIGGSPGKGGGIKRTPTRRTARMHRSGRRYKISAVAVVGDGNGHIGMGRAQALENREAVDKAVIAAKLNMIPIKRACGSWECACNEKHSIPVKVEGKSGSVRVVLMPAPKGIGLCINDEAKKIIRLAGIKDVWSMSSGESKSRVNYSFALFDAFKKMNSMKFPEDYSPDDMNRPVAREETFDMEDSREEAEEASEEEPERIERKRKSEQ